MLNASYFDGHSARRHAAAIEFGDGGVLLRGDIDKRYALDEVRVAEPFAHAPTVLYFADGARCELPESVDSRWLEERFGYRSSRVVRWQQQLWGALVALVLLAALLAWGAFWGVPAAADRIVAALPPSADHAVGAGIVQALDKKGLWTPSRLSESQRGEVERILRDIAPPDMRIPLLLRYSHYQGPNAMALPDGSIVVLDDLVVMLLDNSGQFDAGRRAALAGILAHEIGHLRARHSMRTAVASSLSAALSAALFGDFSGASALAATFANLSYSRAMETEADDFAIELLHSKGIPTLPLADFLEYLDRIGPPEDEDDTLPRWMYPSGADFLETHPLNAKRAQRLREAQLVERPAVVQASQRRT